MQKQSFKQSHLETDEAGRKTRNTVYSLNSVGPPISSGRFWCNNA